MYEQFINYQEAKDLKELGFNEKCAAHYLGEEREDLELKWEIYRNLSINTTYLIQAPTYGQVFRWFRDRGLYSAVNTDQTMEPKYAFCISRFSDNDGWETIVFNSDLYYEYENAQLDCLRELIEILKQNI